MSRAPAVSVVIPAYRGAPWIRAAVESALARTHGDLEVLVVDDASDDGTADVAPSVRDPRVRAHAAWRARRAFGRAAPLHPPLPPSPPDDSPGRPAPAGSAGVDANSDRATAARGGTRRRAAT